MKHPLISSAALVIFLLLTIASRGQEQLLRKMTKVKATSSAAESTKAKLPKAISIPKKLVGTAPTVVSVSPAKAGNGTIIVITGTEFEDGITVSVGGVEMKKISVTAATSLSVELKDAKAGDIVIKNAAGSATFSSFEWVDKPTIKEVTPKNFTKGTAIQIKGARFVDPVKVWIDEVEQGVTVIDEETVELVVKGSAEKGVIELKAAGGQTMFGANQPLDAAANLTAPLVGQGINIVPTPTFNYTHAHDNNWFGFRAAVWGNTLGTDSSIKKVVSNLLVPQISLLGLKVEGIIRLTNLKSNFQFALVGQLNCLLKKVAFFDTTSKKLSAFNPFVLHPRAGFTANFFNNNFFAGGFLNMFSIVTENDQFKDFFDVKKATFVYPNFNFGGIFDFTNGGKQSMKIEFDLVINNGETRMLFSSTDKVIPYLKVSLLSDL